ncbi:tetratricopeptide repeat protein [Treponema parvum]|uniref:Tetratricopeptide repeat protein n=1 Tax=Treponema parvum TaxID=138851 RepID=A0A975ICP0_9SPIR|nr:tetratricopeptide repeat protein [Treponema parvum]QTQ12120.1 tetratricopeptide repeat protein [Treponema parvum]
MMKRISLIPWLFLCIFFAYPQEKPDALRMYIQGNYLEAIKICEGEIASEPVHADSFVVLCWSLVANKQYAVAEQRASDGLALSPYDLRLVEVLGEAKYYQGKNREALELFERYLAGIPDSGSRVGAAYYFMGEIYIRQAKYQHADISFTAAVKKDPLMERWWTRLGYARERAKNYVGAAAAYDKALELNPSQDDAVAGKSRISNILSQAPAL